MPERHEKQVRKGEQKQDTYRNRAGPNYRHPLYVLQLFLASTSE